MLNLVSSMTDAVKSLNEINEKLSSQESAIECQKGEIVKTEAIIKQYQDWLKSQMDMLEVFMKQKEKTEEEKSKILIVIQEFNNVSKNGTNEVAGSVGNSKSNPISFDSTYEILKCEKSITFYQEITDRLAEISPHNEVNYINQTMIPNKLKSSTVPRRMVLYKIVAIGEYPLQEIIRQPITMSIDIHVSTGSGELLSVRGDDQHQDYHVTIIECCNSYIITQSQVSGTQFILLVNVAPMVMALDIVNVAKISLDSCTHMLEKEGYAVIPPINITDYSDSFIKRALTQKEIREKLLFIDVSFAQNIHESLVPISITAMNYEGKVLINTLMCPRTEISAYGEIQHGLVEKNVIGTPDTEEIMRRFYRLIWDRILVGHNMQEKIRDLKIDMNYICGVRDLQSGAAIRDAINPNKKQFKITEIVNRILKQQRPNGVYSTEQNALIFRMIYIAIESKWRDSVSVEELASKGNTAVSRWDQDKVISSKYNDPKKQKLGL